MNQKTALVTGANAGMGRAATLALMEKGYHVVMACRSRQRGEAALADMKAACPDGSASLLLCDLGDLASVRACCNALKISNTRLDALILNAGVLKLRRQETKDGLEQHFGICHIGHFLLTLSVLDYMKEGSRIVAVGSVAHKIGSIDFDDLPMKKRYNVLKAYSRAKLCNLLFTNELARRVRDRGITVNCVHPGMVITGIGANRTDQNGISRLRKAAGSLLRFMVKTPEQGASAAVYVATSPECEGISGAYFAGKKIARPSKRSQETALARKLWDVSEQITGTGVQQGNAVSKI